MIGLLLLIAACAWKGLENIVEGANNWTRLVLGLTAITLLVAAMRFTPGAGTLTVARWDTPAGAGDYCLGTSTSSPAEVTVAWAPTIILPASDL